jgi:hypothetical protein
VRSTDVEEHKKQLRNWMLRLDFNVISEQDRSFVMSCCEHAGTILDGAS